MPHLIFIGDDFTLKLTKKEAIKYDLIFELINYKNHAHFNQVCEKMLHDSIFVVFGESNLDFKNLNSKVIQVTSNNNRCILESRMDYFFKKHIVEYKIIDISDLSTCTSAIYPQFRTINFTLTKNFANLFVLILLTIKGYRNSERKVNSPANTLFEIFNKLLTPAYFLKTYVIDRLVIKYFSKKYDWNVQIKNTNNNQLLNLTSCKNYFYADPFVFQSSNKIKIIYEKFLKDEKYGTIELADINYSNNIIESRKVVINDGIHRSYPFVIEHFGNIFLIPESKRKQTLEIYKWCPTVENFKFLKSVLDGKLIVDPTIYKDERSNFWLFTNESLSTSGDSGSHLFIYKIDSPEMNEIQSHSKNPVIVDCRIARSAGNFFIHSDKVIRPSQYCDGSIYGKEINYIEITELTLDDFNFNLISYDSFSNGIKIKNQHHHRSFLNEYIASDYI